MNFSKASLFYNPAAHDSIRWDECGPWCQKNEDPWPGKRSFLASKTEISCRNGDVQSLDLRFFPFLSTR